MKTHKVELPDGTALFIEGGTDHQVANIIQQRMAQGGLVVSNVGGDEPPLAMPVMNFGTPPGLAENAATEDAEVLLMKTEMNFG